SGRTNRHRLNRGGDRAANTALHTIALSRLRWDPRTRAYMMRRRQEGLTKPEVMRCFKRYIAREIYRQLIGAPPSANRKPTAA
ncbi:MAG TPA: transposase, partial [Pseudonocardiaceae bacterium]